MEKVVLTDDKVYPDDNVISIALGQKSYGIYLVFLEKLKELRLNLEWRFYNDGKMWLGKLLNGSKNMGWLSIWNVGFKVTVFFNERTLIGLSEFDLSNNIDFFRKEVQATGKLLPLRTTINSHEILGDIIKILEYKMRVK